MGTAARALITGASAGFGELFARRLAAAGTSLVLVARRRERLEALADELRAAHGVEIEVIVADLCDEGERGEVEARLGRDPAVDLLINNAGFGHYGPFSEHDPAHLTELIALDVLAVTRLSRAALPPMIAAGRGTIVHVASLGGLLPTPGSAVYGASKAFVVALTEALAEELRGSGVRVLALCPGYSRTEFQDVADVRAEALPGAAWMPAEDIVDFCLRRLDGRAVIGVPGWGNWLMVQAAPLVPRSWVRRIAGLVNGRFRA